MLPLPSGERIVRCLTGGDIDHVPFYRNIGWSPWGSAMDRWRKESGRPDLDLQKEFRFEAGFACPDLKLGIFPSYEKKTLREEGDTVIFRDERGITLRGRKDGASMPEFLDYPVKTADDWQKLKAERLQPDAPGRLAQNWDEFRARLKASGEAVQVGWFPYGVFGTVRDLMGVEEMLVGFYEMPEVIRDMMDHLTTLWISVWDRTAAEVRIDHIHIWEDMSGRQGSLISPAMITEFMMPCYDRIADFARSHGVRLLSVDTDGDCHELVPLMMKHGINMFLPFEVQAGNDIRQYRREYPTLGILGGLDKRALAASRRDVDVEIEKVRWMIRNGGRYVPGFDHLIPPDASWDNVRHAAVEIRKICLED